MPRNVQFKASFLFCVNQNEENWIIFKLPNRFNKLLLLILEINRYDVIEKLNYKDDLLAVS